MNARLTTACIFLTSFAADAAPKSKLEPILTIDFETTREGEIPRGFEKEGDVAVTAGESHTGKKCLQINPAERGPRRIIKRGDEITRLGDQHWGRLYLKVKLPAPVPVIPAGQNFAVIHSTIVEGSANSPLFHDPIAVRLVDTCTGPGGSLQYIYNVQPSKRDEFGKGSAYDYKFSGEWTLVEWYVDHARQSYRLFIDGQEIEGVEIKNGKAKFEKSEIPAVFESMAFGWNNYQSAGAGFTAWIDDIALGKERIGSKFLEKPERGK
ncbi:hypothetical protein [Luteolibacter sp.]|uniref:hypothetical protein n=1 Tax=Luteolibacter sp. TaxID=1962973 RepID=UPI003267EFE2